MGALYQNGGCIEEPQEPTYALERFLGEKSQKLPQLGHQAVPQIECGRHLILILLLIHGMFTTSVTHKHRLFHLRPSPLSSPPS